MASELGHYDNLSDNSVCEFWKMLCASAHVLSFVEIVKLGAASLVMALMADGGL